MPANSSRRYPPELRERAVRMVAEIRDQHETEWAAMRAVAELLGVGTTETVRKWVRQAEIDDGSRPGVYVPAGYVIVAATGGLDSDMNPVGFREHVNPAYQGLRHIPGAGPYPLQDSFYARGFGVSVRHRGAAVVMQVTENTTYTPPTIQT